MAIIQHPVDRTTLKAGDPIGILYYQKDSNNIWTVGVHNGAYIRYDLKKHAYVVKHAGTVVTNTVTPKIDLIYFYRTLQDLLNDTTIANSKKYVLIKTYSTKSLTAGTSKPAIAWVLTDKTVHDGRFEKFIFDPNYGPAKARNKFTYLSYTQLRQDYPNATALQHGTLYYSHYDLMRVGAGRYAASENATPLPARVLNIRRLYP